MEKVYVGIDLGTTTTLIATAKDTGEIIVLNIFQNDREGREIESSYLKSVAYFPEEGNPLVGLQAEYRGQQDPTRFVRAVKRQMGRRILLPVVEREPYQVSALYLEKALYTAKRKLSGDMVFTVTVPASFTSNQRADTLQALKEACRRTGIRFPDKTGELFISEPVAAMLAFLDQDLRRSVRFRKLDYERDVNRVIVYDIGGGTTDLTQVYIEAVRKPVEKVTDLRVRVEEISYYNPFGGEDFDFQIAEQIYRYFLRQYPELEDLELKPIERLAVRLQFEAIAKEVKEKLSDRYRDLSEDENPFGDIDLSSLKQKYQGEIRVQGQTYMCSGEMSWAELEGCVNGLLYTPSRRGIIAPLRSLLEKSHFSPNDIDGLLLVGGMARFPLIAKVLKEEFDQQKIWVFDPPEHAVVRGAALYSYLRVKEPGFILEEPAADAYYVQTDKGFDQILPSRSRKGEKKVYKLKRDTSELVLHIFSGEDAESEAREEIYHTLIYQGAVRLRLGKEYKEGTQVWVQVLYEGEGSESDHSKLPYLYVWIGDPNGEPQKIPYSEIFGLSPEEIK